MKQNNCKKVLHFVPDASAFHETNYVCHKCHYGYFTFPNQDRFVKNESEFTEEVAKRGGFTLCEGEKRVKDIKKIVLNENKKGSGIKNMPFTINIY